MKAKIECVCCEQILPPSEKDPDFCSDCFERIEHKRKNVMEHARAALAYVQTQPNNRKLAVAGFLGVFHPEMSSRQFHEILRAVE